MTDSYVLTLNPGVNAASAAKRAATYIVDRWRPNNRGGIHLLCTPQLTAKLVQLWEVVNQFDKPAKIRITIEGDRPCLQVLEETWSEA